MTTCPSCDTLNIEGADACESCGQPLSDAAYSAPATHVESSLRSDRVSLLNPKKAVVVSASATVGEVLRQLVAESIGCVLIVDERCVVTGIFSERDAVRRIGTRFRDLRDRPIAEFMTPAPQCLHPESKIAFAVHRMDVGGYRHVPIVDRDKVALGVISVRDILRYLTDRMRRVE